MVDHDTRPTFIETVVLFGTDKSPERDELPRFRCSIDLRRVSFVATRRKREARSSRCSEGALDRPLHVHCSIVGFLISYAVSYFFAGLAYHVAYWETCPEGFK